MEIFLQENKNTTKKILVKANIKHETLMPIIPIISKNLLPFKSITNITPICANVSTKESKIAA